ncbi:MAG: hypothetical protein EPO41_04000 [Reyranella sp.]|uniref:hypothetical protein n=1 Tax=Reyranella sp. TaxID=1929291 RepID=UPI0012299006|nr:hypothetical protein [Reyranella sp.]TAJ97164.1 MAG: hypothetical protein EPO41_04000 [Reyranella sp.]
MTTTRYFDARQLFNCMPNYTAPDWSQYSALEIGAAFDNQGNTIGGQPFDAVGVFYSIYGRRWDGEAEVITDILVDGDALAIAGRLSRLSGLQVSLYRP